MLTWAGSKEKLAGWILDTAMPGVRPTLIVEPYCGSCKVSMEAARRGCRRALVNDCARGLIAVLRAVRDSLDVFLAEARALDRRWRLADRPGRRALHAGWRDRYNANTASPAEVFCLLRSSYSGLYRENRDGKFNVPCRTTAKYDGPVALLHEGEVREFAELAAGWTITCEEGLSITPIRISALQLVLRDPSSQVPMLRGVVHSALAGDNRVDADGALVVIDPPYEGTFTGYVGRRAPSPVELEELVLRWRDAGAVVALCQPEHQLEVWSHPSNTGKVYRNTRPEAFARRHAEPRDAGELLIVWRPS